MVSWLTDGETGNDSVRACQLKSNPATTRIEQNQSSIHDQWADQDCKMVQSWTLPYQVAHYFAVFFVELEGLAC